jgi:hypothetical protein
MAKVLIIPIATKDLKKNGGLSPNNGGLFGDKGTLLEKRNQAGPKTLS